MVESAAFVEVSLRMAFCALVGGKYAAVVAGGMETGWLIDNCEAVARQHHELGEPQRTAIVDALGACRQACTGRNRLIHDLWVGRPGSAMTIRSLRRSYEVTAESRPAGHIRAVADALIRAQHQLLAAVEDALGPESLQLSEQLRAEDAEAGRGMRAAPS